MLAASVLTATSSSMTRTRLLPRTLDRRGPSPSAVVCWADAGRLICIVVPRPGSDATWMKPPWFLTMECAVARPRPLGRGFVLKYGSKILPRVCDGMPTPLSTTDTRTYGPGSAENACSECRADSTTLSARITIVRSEERRVGEEGRSPWVAD